MMKQTILFFTKEDLPMSNNLHTLFPFLHTQEALLGETHMHKHLLSQFESWQKEQQEGMIDAQRLKLSKIEQELLELRKKLNS